MRSQPARGMLGPRPRGATGGLPIRRRLTTCLTNPDHTAFPQFGYAPLVTCSKDLGGWRHVKQVVWGTSCTSCSPGCSLALSLLQCLPESLCYFCRIVHPHFIDARYPSNSSEEQTLGNLWLPTTLTRELRLNTEVRLGNRYVEQR